MTRTVRTLTAIAGILAVPAWLGAQSPTRAGAPIAATPTLRTTGAFFALSVADVDATRAWYAEKLGLSVVMDVAADGGVRAVVMSGGGLTVELVRQPSAVPLRRLAPDANDAGAVHGIFKAGMVVEEFDRAVEALRARGVTFAMGPFPARDGIPANAIFRDSEGNLLQILAR